jgi:hypothetical protein
MSNQIETWKCIPGYSKYIASNLGRIMRLPVLESNSAGRVSGDTKGKPSIILSGRPLPSMGHLQVCLTNDSGDRKMEYVHRLVALAFIKKRPGKEIVLHKDDNPANNNVENLMWGTHYMNSQMISFRNTAITKTKQSITLDRVATLYYTNKPYYSGKSKDLANEIAKDLGISLAYVLALIYRPEAKQYKP